MHRLAALAMLALLTPGCADMDAGEQLSGELDGPADDVGDAKADTGGIRPGTPQAYAAVTFANFASDKEIRAAGLGPMATKNILAVRAGDDGKMFTDDDGFMRTLEELDAVPYVGPAAFKAILRYTKGKVEYLRPLIDGQWSFAFDTVSGFAPVRALVSFHVTDFAQVASELQVLGPVEIGTLPLNGSYADHELVGLYLVPDLDVGFAHLNEAILYGFFRGGETFCGSALVRFSDGTQLSRKLVGVRGATLPDRPTATLCD